jgi:antitoxin MazE
MRTSLVRIGNSKGVRIPKAIRDQLGFTDAVEMTVRGGELVLSPVAHPRAGWEEAFRADPPRPDDENPWAGAGSLTEFDDKDWTW